MVERPYMYMYATPQAILRIFPSAVEPPVGRHLQEQKKCPHTRTCCTVLGGDCFIGGKNKGFLGR